MTNPHDTPSTPIAPHQRLTEYYDDSQQAHRRFVAEVFDQTAPDYERIEQILAFGTGANYRGQALRRGGLVAGMQVLDVGCGTGMVTREAIKILGNAQHVTAVDPSLGMTSAGHFPDGTKLVQGTAESIPLPSAQFDFLSMGYALRHVSDISSAFSEFSRVLKPGGRVCILEIVKPKHAVSTWLLKTYMRVFVPAIAKIVSGQTKTALLWRYYWDTIEACIPPEKVAEALRAAGFVDVTIHREVGVFVEYYARKPE